MYSKKTYRCDSCKVGCFLITDVEKTMRKKPVTCPAVYYDCDIDVTDHDKKCLGHIVKWRRLNRRKSLTQMAQCKECNDIACTLVSNITGFDFADDPAFYELCPFVKLSKEEISRIKESIGCVPEWKERIEKGK